MASAGKKKIPFLPLTKLQRDILEEHFRKRGHGEGYQRTYQRLKLAIGNKDHYAMDNNGNIARTDDGEIYEEVDQPTKVMNHTYNYKGRDYNIGDNISANAVTALKKNKIPLSQCGNEDRTNCKYPMVNCGNHEVATCEMCTLGLGRRPNLCNGECTWNGSLH